MRMLAMVEGIMKVGLVAVNRRHEVYSNVVVEG
jgi:hypothetical protein